MLANLRNQLLPDHQRRSIEELALELDPGSGDVAAKRSAFWSMLTLSAVIAAAGVLSDSTATVIGAMIIAPLSTPIMGVALALVKRERSSALLLALVGAILVVLVGLLFSTVLPGSYNVHTNSQIASRTSPGLWDLTAALATGFAGSIALARRDVAAILPGVAIAISLVPPLVVAGVCLGVGESGLALGTMLLFLSNLVSLVVAGTMVFAVLGYAEATTAAGRSRRQVRLVLAALLVGVTLPLFVNTAASVMLSLWSSRVETTAKDWISTVPGAEVTEVENRSTTFIVHVRTPADLPLTSELLDDLASQVPRGLQIVVETTTGREIQAGKVGDG